MRLRLSRVRPRDEIGVRELCTFEPLVGMSKEREQHESQAKGQFYPSNLIQKRYAFQKQYDNKTSEKLRIGFEPIRLSCYGRVVELNIRLRPLEYTDLRRTVHVLQLSTLNLCSIFRRLVVILHENYFSIGIIQCFIQIGSDEEENIDLGLVDAPMPTPEAGSKPY
jgi:hypothetical protein